MSIQTSFRATPPQTTLWVNVPVEEAIDYRSVPGRAASPTRRIDISSGFDLTVSFWRLRPAPSGGIERECMGVFVLDGGVPLIWPVPESARFEDVLVTMLPFDGEPAHGPIHIGDHWHTS